MRLPKTCAVKLSIECLADLYKRAAKPTRVDADIFPNPTDLSDFPDNLRVQAVVDRIIGPYFGVSQTL